MHKRFYVVFFSLVLIPSFASAQSKPNWGRDYVYGIGGRLTVTVEPDTYAPSTPTGFSYTFATPNCLLNLSWNAAADIGSGVSKYNIYKDSVLFDSVTGTSDSLIQGLHSSVHTYTLSAVDVAGNESGRAAKTISWPGCTGGPVIPQTQNLPRGLPRNANTVVAVREATFYLWESRIPVGNKDLFLARLRRLQKSGQLTLFAPAHDFPGGGL